MSAGHHLTQPLREADSQLQPTGSMSLRHSIAGLPGEGEAEAEGLLLASIRGAGEAEAEASAAGLHCQ